MSPKLRFLLFHGYGFMNNDFFLSPLLSKGVPFLPRGSAFHSGYTYPVRNAISFVAYFHPTLTKYPIHLSISYNFPEKSLREIRNFICHIWESAAYTTCQMRLRRVDCVELLDAGGIGPATLEINWGGLCSAVDNNRLI